MYYFRLAYTISQSLCLFGAFLVYRRICALNDTSKIKVPEPTKPFSDASPSTKEMTIRDYDATKVSEFVSQTLISICFMFFLHWQFAFMHPLLIQAVMSIKNALFMPIFQIHLLRRGAEGPLERPFKPPANPFADLFKQDDDQATTTTTKDNVAPKKPVLPDAAAAAPVVLPLKETKAD